jgi:hypothetical protein
MLCMNTVEDEVFLLLSVNDQSLFRVFFQVLMTQSQ